MDYNYIHSLAPSDNGLKDVTVEDIQKNPKLLDIFKSKLVELENNYHVVTDTLKDRDGDIEDLKEDLKSTPSMTARLAISALNVAGATCMSFDNKQVFYVGAAAVAIASILNIFCKKIK